MASIIEQIQQDALDYGVTVSSLLRRVKLAATKLGLDDIESWVEKELNGYDSADLPKYRIVHGRPMARHPYRGWEPIGGHIEKLSVRHVAQSIASLEELAKAPADTAIHFAFSDSVVKRLNDYNDTAGWPAVLEVDRSTIIGILDRVRTLVLDWALKMERIGVLGTDFSFDATDKAKAQGAGTIISIGSIGSFAGNLGAANVSGDIVGQEIDTKLIGNLAEQIKLHAEELARAGVDRQILQVRIQALEGELRKSKPSGSIVRGLLADLRTALAGAVGNLVASGALAFINQALGTGVPLDKSLSG